MAENTQKASVFATLQKIDCNEHKEQKNGLSYLSWAWAWQMLKTNYPDATYKVYENADGWNYHTDGRTCWVKVGVSVNGEELTEYLPVMDYKNASIPANLVTSFDVNKAIQRALTKAIARHGLGLYIYAGEDFPDAADDERRRETNERLQKAAREKAKTEQAASADPYARFGSDAAFWKAVDAHAAGKKTKTGEDIRQWFMTTYKPNKTEIEYFDNMVELRKAAQQ